MDAKLLDVKPAAQKLFGGYGDSGEPLLGYGALAAVYTTVFSMLLGAAHRASAVPEKIALADVGLIGVATFRLSRLITKDKVTSGLRAPFTRFEKAAGSGEVEEDARGEGLQRAIGDMVTCPYCIGLWVATGLAFGLVFAPRPTRLLASILSSVAISDACNHGYLRLKESTQSR
ncbi:MAG: DUF1360 domain-containing protein [Verrucomicrobia bacterium]|nr:DUF1360 domain-containing protein [Verrucomicrobiota bacterium]